METFYISLQLTVKSSDDVATLPVSDVHLQQFSFQKLGLDLNWYTRVESTALSKLTNPVL